MAFADSDSSEPRGLVPQRMRRDGTFVSRAAKVMVSILTDLIQPH